MSVRSQVTLRLTTADGAVRDVVLDEEMLIVGSGPAAGLHVHDPAVSSLHLLLKRHHDTVLAIDLAGWLAPVGWLMTRSLTRQYVTTEAASIKAASEAG